MNWLTHAACAGYPTDWWFAERFPTLIERAKRICTRCDVRVECQAHAMEEKIDYGVWGGLTAEERAKARNARKRARR